MKTQRTMAAILLAGVIAIAFGCSHSAAQSSPGMKAAAAVSYDRPGFVTVMQDGRLWVFRDGAKEIEEFRKHGELVKQVIRPGAGPNGMTLKAPDSETINDYLKAK
jgi:predicted phage tail protein